MKKIFLCFVVMSLLLSGCSTSTVDGAGKELADTITNITDADNKYVQMVKGGYRVDNPSLTYEDVFSAFFGTPRWKYFKSEDGQDVVEFTGDCTYQDVPVKARIQFIVDEENGTFEAARLAFNEVPQDALTLAALIGKAFSEAENSNAESGGNDAAVQMAYAEKVQELAWENNDLRFALIDLTQNDVPELVADYPGYYVSVYMWADGAVVPVMDSWPYGVAGNQGYEYLPGQNVIRNFNSDMAGAIVYESYMSVNSAHEVEDLPMEDLSIWYFRDKNGNGYPDEGEDYSEDPVYYYGDTEVSAEVYASHQIAGNYEWISGEQSVEEILSVLGVESGGTQFGERTFMMEGDEISMFTLRQDGVFTLEVNLYVGSGTLFGSYEEDGKTIRCYVEVCSFEGYIGDDVSEFEMVYENGHLVYHGETVGTTVDGAVYYQG